MRRVLGGLLAILALACGLLFIDEFVTGVTSGNFWKYWAMVVYGTAAFGATMGARKLIARSAARPVR